ncbi:hypothetical protein [Haloparvum sp. PAK95]|uniref:hypothetical protein n=1 Tax=Haloparvum sp. PAK95 TaxID=3418962 RepID=UPI003D2F4193
MNVSATLSEPQVLAHTKRRLFPETTDGDGRTARRERTGTYAVTDTQFATGTWLRDEPIPEAVQETLAPFNHVAVGSGYPDLLGVRALESELLAVERLGDEPPLVAVEAKGHAGGTVDVERGIVQAHDRLGEANAAYVAAPKPAITGTNRALARDLNVGVLGVEAAGSGGVAATADAVEILEVPRVVGHTSHEPTNAVRFQASAQGVADQSFGLNHPKNYLGYPLALYAAGDTETVVKNRVVGAVDDARRGAAFLGLIEERPNRTELTSLGREVVRFALREYADVDAALGAFADWAGSPRRFSALAPKWGQLARRVVWAYPATELLVEELQALHEDGHPEPTLVDLVTHLHETRPSLAVELFVRGTDESRRQVLTTEGELRREALTDGAVYHAPTVFQLKAILYHAGFLTERGAEPHRIDPTADVWALREALDPF